jgi:DNA helicase IV
MFNNIISRLEGIYNSYLEVERCLDENKYISAFDLNQIKASHATFTSNIPFTVYILSLFNHQYFLIPFKHKKLLKKLNGLIYAHNEKFILAEIKDNQQLFDHLFSYPLDDQQRHAIVVNEDNNLIIAGAGTGKTTTIAGKIKYLLDKGTGFDEILALAFTKDAAVSLKNTMGIEDKKENCSTFHSFGLKVLLDVEGQKHVSVMSDEEEIRKLISEIFTQIQNDTDSSQFLLDFFLNEKIYKSQFEFDTLGEYIQYMKDQNYVSYKKIPAQYFSKLKNTYQREVVRSQEECIIANYLFINKIDYEYEKIYPYTLSKTEYRPDFTIFQNGKTYYLEHFAISRDKNVPPFFKKSFQSYEAARNHYVQQIDWKRNLHATNKTNLIESYSYEFIEGQFIQKLEEKLKNAGIVPNPMTPKELWEYILEDNNHYKLDFVNLMVTAIALYKSNLRDIEFLYQQNELVKNPNTKERNQKLIRLFEIFYNLYQQAMEKTNQIDFHDMINRAAKYLSEGLSTRKYNYIFIDEFQDMSIGRYKLIQALKQKNPSVKLYCVGDDWQSIFRFAGADLALFERFEDYFGVTSFSNIDTTYRFGSPVLETTSQFIMKNPSQKVKNLKVDGDKHTEYEIIEFSSDEEEVNQVSRLIDNIYQHDPDIKREDIFIIGRYTFDKDVLTKNLTGRFKHRIINKDEILSYASPQTGKTHEVTYKTAHKVKGRQTKYSIIINCNSGSTGFPAQKSDDPFLRLMLSEQDDYQNAEERRLFYVAMTRASEKTYILTNASKTSSFIGELRHKTDRNIHKCPVCIEGNLITRKNKQDGNEFYACSNYPWCTYTSSV